MLISSKRGRKEKDRAYMFARSGRIGAIGASGKCELRSIRRCPPPAVCCVFQQTFLHSKEREREKKNRDGGRRGEFGIRPTCEHRSPPLHRCGIERELARIRSPNSRKKKQRRRRRQRAAEAQQRGVSAGTIPHSCCSERGAR